MQVNTILNFTLRSFSAGSQNSKLIMSITILITGGTFDKEYDELNGTLYFKQTHLPEMLKLGRCTVEATVHTLMMIDSLEMTEENRGLIHDYCERCEEDKIVI